MIKVNGIVIEQNHFPDGTLLMKLLPDDMLNDRGNVKIEWIYENDSELFTLICIKRHMDRHFSHGEAVLVMPYLAHARMDRVKTDEDVFTLKYFCEVINSLGFKIVWVLDVHSTVSLALIENVINLSPAPEIRKAIQLSNTNALFFPDEGAMKRYSSNCSRPFAFGMKKRDWETGKILGLDILQSENIVGKDVLIIDDICSRGGTFYHSAKALLEAGAASVSLYVTHCENTILEGEIFTSGLIKQVYTTKSLVHCDELKEKVIYV